MAEPSLVELIDNTESMDSVEKEMWKDVLPSMTEKQKNTFSEIIKDEHRILAEIEKKHKEAVKESDKRIEAEWENLKDYLE